MDCIPTVRAVTAAAVSELALKCLNGIRPFTIVKRSVITATQNNAKDMTAKNNHPVRIASEKRLENCATDAAITETTAVIKSIQLLTTTV